MFQPPMTLGGAAYSLTAALALAEPAMAPETATTDPVGDDGADGGRG